MFIRKYIYLILFVVFFLNSKLAKTNSAWLVYAASSSSYGDFMSMGIESNNDLQTLTSLNRNSSSSREFDVIFSDDRSIYANKSILNLDSDAVFDDTESEASYGTFMYPLPAKILIVVCAGSASIITVCGNLLVMCSFFFDRQIRNPTNYFILSLSVSDFIIGSLSIPFLTLFLVVGEWPFGQFMCNMWLSIDYSVNLTSILTVLFITIDRFCSVKMPAKYRKWRSANKIIVMVLLTWAIPISLFFTSIFGWSYGSAAVFDPKSCDVAWASNKIFSVALVLSYFWSTLVAIIVLYIFIYQVARNLEKKSRQKQRKITSLVGTAANTGTMVGVMALQTNVVVTKINEEKEEILNSPEEIDEDFNTDSQSKLSHNNNSSNSNNKNFKSKKKKEHMSFIKNFTRSGTAVASAGVVATTGGTCSVIADANANNLKKNPNTNLTNAQNTDKYSNNNNKNATVTNVTATSLNDTFSKNKKNDSTGAIKINESKKAQTKQQNQNSSYTSKDEDYSHSTSYEDSHSDYDSNIKKKKMPLISRNNFSSSKKVKSNIIKEHKSTPPLQNETLQQQQQPLLLPRPETLAVISNEVFSEKLVSSLSRQTSPNSRKPSPNTEPVKKVEELSTPSPPPPPPPPPQPQPQSTVLQLSQAQEKLESETVVKESIPFIDDEFDELSYVLHRRQFGDKENKVPIKEETIFIKSSIRNSFIQKFATPLRRSFTRKSSQKSLSKNDSSLTGATITTNNTTIISNNAPKYKLEIVPNEKIIQQTEASKLNNESTPDKAALNTFSNSNALKPNIIPVLNSSPNSQMTKYSNKTPVLDKQISLPSRQISSTAPPPSNNNNYKSKGKNENRARKALRTISFILGAFIFCFAPWHVVVIVNSFCTNCWQYTIYHHFYYSCYFLCYMNSPINPFMYALANQQFSKTFFRILKGDLRRL